ncbi:MAG TPA: recombinase family protein [Amycolatopsis sp.]|uniref:recombinase family protein n=1 Tax=Amycolatopsis sp. TaxID=37632 RepID=UPI002B47EA9E|nr:recombinase family protein [Amycolatopsis sp.]HKS45115.1 recombinase family protein [Amycolatopsis sp.]
MHPEPRPEEAHVVRLVFRFLRARVSTRQIAAYLERRGYRRRNGKPFTPREITHIGRNPIYAGLRQHDHNWRDVRNGEGTKNVELVPAQWDSIVGEELFYEVQTILNDPKRRTVRPGLNFLTMFTKCAVCGGPLGVRKDGKATGFHVPPGIGA